MERSCGGSFQQGLMTKGLSSLFVPEVGGSARALHPVVDHQGAAERRMLADRRAQAVHAVDVVGSEYLGGRSARGDFAFAHQRDAVRVLRRKIQVVQDGENAEAF